MYMFSYFTSHECLCYSDKQVIVFFSRASSFFMRIIQNTYLRRIYFVKIYYTCLLPFPTKCKSCNFITMTRSVSDTGDRVKLSILIYSTKNRYCRALKLLVACVLWKQRWHKDIANVYPNITICILWKQRDTLINVPYYANNNKYNKHHLS
jgi:hypothetical protein